MPTWTTRALSDAESVYRSCVWEMQDKWNQTWADDVVPLVERFEVQIVSELERLYRRKLFFGGLGRCLELIPERLGESVRKNVRDPDSIPLKMASATSCGVAFSISIPFAMSVSTGPG